MGSEAKKHQNSEQEWTPVPQVQTANAGQAAPDRRKAAATTVIGSIARTGVAERAFILVGGGSNGKSVWRYAATTPAQTLMVNRHGTEQTNDLAKLVGIQFVTAAETEKGQRLAESKRITGGDRIACRELYKNLFEYDPQFKIWLATNDAPQFSGGDHSISRRIRVIEFPVTFVKPA